MAAIPAPPSRPYSSAIITPDVWPVGRPSLEAARETWATQREKTVAALAEHRSALTQIEQSARSAGFDAMYDSHCRNYGTLSAKLNVENAIIDVHGHAINATAELEVHLENLDWRAHQDLSRLPKGSPAATAVIAAANADAHRAATATGDAITTWTASFITQHGPLPAAPTPSSTDVGQRGDHGDESSDTKKDISGDSASPRSVPRLGDRTDHLGSGDPRGDAAGSPSAGSPLFGQRGEMTPGPGLPGQSIPSSPLSGGMGGGGLGGSSGSLGGGGLSGLGSSSSSNPLSSLTSGLGETPAAGMGGVPGAAGGMPNAAGQAAAVNPASFSRGVAAGSSVGGAISPVTQQPAPPATLADPSAPAAPPPAGVAAAGPAGPSSPAAVAGSGVHTPVSAGSAGVPGPAPMMIAASRDGCTGGAGERFRARSVGIASGDNRCSGIVCVAGEPAAGGDGG
jgi:hypothetical protein